MPTSRSQVTDLYRKKRGFCRLSPICPFKSSFNHRVERGLDEFLDEFGRGVVGACGLAFGAGDKIERDG